MTLKSLHLIAFAIVCTRCTSIDPQPAAPVALQEPVVVEQTAALPIELNCDQEVSCDTASQSRIFCKAVHQKGQSVTWGTSGCSAAKQLKAQLCAAGITAKDITDIHCQPDTSAGECPAAPMRAFCTSADLGVEKKVQCVVQQYAGRKLAASEQLDGFGFSQCQARQDLLWKTCQAGLQPSLNGPMVCTQLDQTAAGKTLGTLDQSTHSDPPGVDSQISKDSDHETYR